MRYDKDTFKEVISPKRWIAMTKYLYENKDSLFNWALEKGIITPELINEKHALGEDEYKKFERCVLFEVNSRTIGIKVLKQIYKGTSVSIKQMPLYCRYDIETSDGKKYEFKFRINDNDQYDTDRIDEDKKIWTVTTTEDDVVLVYTCWDGITRAYDMAKPDRRTPWNKPNGSVAKFSLGEDVDYIEKQSLEYFPENITWSAATIMPTFISSV